MRSIHICVAALMVLVSVSRTEAIPGRGPELERIIDDSTFIVVADLVSVEEGVGLAVIDSANLEARFGLALQPPRQINARVDRGSFAGIQVLKGDPTFSFTVDYLLPEEFLGWAAPGQGAFGIFFLRHTDSGELEFTDPGFPSAPVLRGVRGSGESVHDRVIDMLGASLEADVERRSMTAIMWLEYSTSSSSLDALRRGLRNPDRIMRLRTARALTWRGDPSGLEVIKATFLPRPPALPDDLEVTIPNGVASHLGVPDLIPDLENLLESGSAHMRRGAVQALWRTDSSAASAALRKALDDVDFDVRYWAVVGLAEISGQRAWRPGIEEFQSDERKYIERFRLPERESPGRDFLQFPQTPDAL